VFIAPAPSRSYTLSLHDALPILAIGLEDELGIADLPPEILDAHPQPTPDDFRQVLQAYMNDTVPLAEIEKRYILSVLQQFGGNRSEEHTSELQSLRHLVCRLLLE